MFAKLTHLCTMVLTIGILRLDYINSETFNDQKRLYVYLSRYMDTGIRPVLNQSKTLHVNAIPVLVKLHGLNEISQELSATVAIRLTWRYETLTWNSSQFGGIQDINVPASRLWTPDITYDNAFRESSGLSQTGSVTVEEDGAATWHTGVANLKTGCKVDITKYPFDTQTCKVVLGKMIYNDYQETVRCARNKVVIRTDEENNEWSITDTDIKYIQIHDNVTYIKLLFVLERRYLFYILNIIIPVIMLSMMNVFTFKLPPSSGERVSYGISLLLTYVVLINMISNSIPKVSKSVSYLQLYIITQFVKAIVISILSITFVRMTENKHETNFPKFVHSMYEAVRIRGKSEKTKYIDNINGLTEGTGIITKKPVTNEDMPRDTTIEVAVGNKTSAAGAENMEAPDEEAMKIVRFLDNFGFWIFMCMFVISTITCLLAMIF